MAYENQPVDTGFQDGPHHGLGDSSLRVEPVTATGFTVWLSTDHDGYKGVLPPAVATDKMSKIQSAWAAGWNWPWHAIFELWRTTPRRRWG